ncbi:hypothetical protein [Olsenella phocaeensis]|uniref:hypothetical protein n=1 Tax=Olsenella phocaeensis TaxID=1852385 RepID=UPI003A8DDA1D
MELIEMPLGNVGLWLDNEPYSADGLWEVVDTSDYGTRHPVDGNMRIAYRHEPDGASHVLECRLDPSCACEGSMDSGERLEATEIEGGGTVLVIGVEYDFEDFAHGHGEHEYDYTATADGLTATVELPVDAKAQWIVFGVSWITGYDDESRTNPWLAVDPMGDRLKLEGVTFDKEEVGAYGYRSVDFFMEIERPWERKADILKLFEGCEIVEHTNAEEGYGRLYDEETEVEVANPSGGEGIWMEFGSEYTLGIGGWHTHYDGYERDYRFLKRDIRAILAGDMRFAIAFVGESDWRGSSVLDKSLPEDADGWAVLRSMDLPREHMDEFAAKGGVVKVVSWVPELCRTLRVEPR